jgi:hypothetical protein
VRHPAGPQASLPCAPRNIRHEVPAMKKIAALSLLSVALASANAFAAEGAVPAGIPHLNHVYLIMMENHGYSQILSNPNAPFINAYAAKANHATSYFAIAHPSLNNYLEVVGGSNFGVHADNPPDWHDASCKTNLATGVPATDTPATANICPIAGTGTDAATPAVDLTNEASGPPGTYNIDGTLSIPAAPNTIAKTIADQLTAAGMTWKTYQESLPQRGPDLVNVSDGNYDNSTDFSKVTPVQNPPLTQADVVALYAVKHNPFVYFANMQNSAGYAHMAAFDGPQGFYADLQHPQNRPDFAFIVPNQCNDEHGRGNAGPFCDYDPDDNGTQGGLNPALINDGDVAVQKLVKTIKGSPGWAFGNNAIVVVWDENDYSSAPYPNKVLLIVDTNYGVSGTTSTAHYDHFSLLKTLEAGFGLPCLNHACDTNEKVMSDLFAIKNR